MLPESKHDFPKLLYLDQNKWIDLSRAHYGHQESQRFRDALAAVRQAVATGKLVVPFSLVNMTEMRADPRAERRKRLARFMVDLSCNRTILPFMTIQSWEVRNAVYAFYGLAEPGCIRPSIVCEGLANALALRFTISGLPPEIESLVIQEANSPENSVDYLIDSGERRQMADRLKAEEAATLGHLEKVRSWCARDEISEDQRWTAELSDHFLSGDVGTAVVAGLQEIGVSLPEFYDKVPTSYAFKNFLARVHTLEVTLTLTLARDRELRRRIHRNDSRDVIWLSVALPYANIVVSENFWGHLVRSSRLDAKYGTTLITDTSELPGRLTELGCL